MSEPHTARATSASADLPRPEAPLSQNAGVLLAIAVGAEFNAFRWWWKQTLLTRNPGCWNEASAALTRAAERLRRTAPDSVGAGVLSSFRDVLGGLLLRMIPWLTNYGHNLMLHSLRGTPLVPDFDRAVRHKREEVLAASDWSGLLREQLYELFEQRERGAFELGEDIDQGRHPQSVQAHLAVADAPPLTVWQALSGPPPYLGSEPIEAGVLAPDESWERDVTAKWGYVFGTPPEPVCRALEAARLAAVAPQRVESVAQLLGMAVSLSPPESPPLSSAPVAAGEAPAGLEVVTKNEGSRLPLRFIEGHHLTGGVKGKNFYRIYNVVEPFNLTAPFADFSKSPASFRIVRYLADLPGPESTRSGCCKASEIFQTLWRSPSLTGREPESDTEALIATYISFARKALPAIGWAIPDARGNRTASRKSEGYQLCQQACQSGAAGSRQVSEG